MQMNFTTNFGKRATRSNNNSINKNITNKTLVNDSPHKIEDTTKTHTIGALLDKQSMLSRSLIMGMLYNVENTGCTSCRGAK